MKKFGGTAFSGLSLFAGFVLPAACAGQEAAHQPPQQAQLTQAISTPERQAPPEPISPAARAILKERMASHARDMGELVSAIMLLKYPEIAQRADAIAADVNLSRPVTGDATELNSSLPEKFFVRQDDLKAAARVLGNSARNLDPYRVANAYGKLSEACVRCHADYRPRD
jgi:cytochrome c556